jgi:dienelactone hydrolase
MRSDAIQGAIQSAMRKHIVLAAILLGLGGAVQAAAPESIEIPADDKPLPALLYRPDGDGPFPAIIALHGCDGLRGNAGRVRRPLDDWGQRLSAAGFIVLFPDSYSSRGLMQQCSSRAPRIRPDRERVVDLRAARDWLQQQDFTRKDRISLLGWGNGGITALWAVRPNLEPADDRPDFRSAAVFYPGCRRLGDTAWSTRIPTLVLIGALDDWAPAKHCEQMVAGARKRSALAVIMKYKGAHHYFDHENLTFRQRRGVAFAPDSSGRVSVGSNNEARADALKRIPQWLGR